MSSKPTYSVDNRLLDDLSERVYDIESNWDRKFLISIFRSRENRELDKISFVEMRKIQFLHKKYVTQTL